jgi:plastocyanin
VERVARRSVDCSRERSARARRGLAAGTLALLVFAAPVAGYESGSITPSGSLRGVVRRGKKASEEALTLDVRECEFVPRVLAMTVGQRLQVRNGDPVVHNPQGQMGRVPVFNVALPARGQVIDVTRRFTQPGVVRLRCGVHGEMSGWIVVHDSPYFAVSDESGAFEIRGIPPGTYRVTVWHEPFKAKGVGGEVGTVHDTTKRLTKKVTVGADATATVEFELR